MIQNSASNIQLELQRLAMSRLRQWARHRETALSGHNQYVAVVNDEPALKPGINTKRSSVRWTAAQRYADAIEVEHVVKALPRHQRLLVQERFLKAMSSEAISARHRLSMKMLSEEFRRILTTIGNEVAFLLKSRRYSHPIWIRSDFRALKQK